MILCLCCVFPFNAKANDISEDQALAILITKIQVTDLYKSRLKMKCLNFTNEAETKEYFDFKVQENHNGKHCSGDKSTAPTVDRFRVSKLTKKIMWFEPINGKFCLFQRSDKEEVIADRMLNSNVLHNKTANTIASKNTQTKTHSTIKNTRNRQSQLRVFFQQIHQTQAKTISTS